MKVHPGAYAATAAVVVAYLAVGVPASGEAGTRPPAPAGTAVQCPRDVSAPPASPDPASGTGIEVTVPRFTFL
ncbi:MAG: hypothetical protein JO079_07710, partial [Frankiaceae bacterium]|nr:hypothetical protein [Frankiaceae bacterium]